VHTITISDGPGATQKQEGIKAGQTARFTVAPGTWKVTVQAYFGTVLIAEGSSNVNVKSGENSPVPIDMKEAPAVFTSIEAFKLWLDTKPTNNNDYPYEVKLNIGDSNMAALSQLMNDNCVYPNEKYVNLDLSGSMLTSIWDDTFYLCYNLTGITLPSSGINSIGNKAFSCAAIVSMTIPKGVTYIGENAFDGCSSLASVTIPNTINTIEARAFRDCISLESITIPYSVGFIQTQAFQNSGLKSVFIPNSVTDISLYAFSSCSYLTSVEFESDSIWFSNNNTNAFDGDLVTKYQTNGAGTYTYDASTGTWQKQ
jgi:hypothetical protein